MCGASARFPVSTIRLDAGAGTGNECISFREVNKCRDAPTQGYWDYQRGIHMMEKLNAQALIRATRRLKQSGWKYQTQRFMVNRLAEIAQMEREIKEGTYKPSNGSTFEINENGHRRIVKSMRPRDAVFQHALADEILIPGLTRYLIHDNGAGQKGKGISFTRRRLEQHLHWHFRRYGTEGYVLLIDFSKYFDNIRHDIAMDRIQRKIKDEKVLYFIRQIFDSYKVDISYSNDDNIMDEIFNALEYQKIPEELKTGKRYMLKSLGIGSPIAQIVGLFLPSEIDNYIKSVKGIHCYDVYMDDRIIIHPDKQYLKDLTKDIEGMAGRLGIHMNPRKTQIVKLSHGFTWLKTGYRLTKTGKIVKKIPRDVVRRERRKLKRLAEKVKAGEITESDYINLYKSWRGDKKKYNAYHTLMNMDLLVRRLLK